MTRLLHGYVPGRVPIFGTYHPPTVPARSVAYVICPPIGWESIQCYHGLRRLGETLAQAGFPTLRMAYEGTGESPGFDEDDGRVLAWLGSIHQAVDCLAAVDGVKGVGLIGIRMGATFAAHVAAEREVASLVLWELCPSGAQYVREMEILASAAPGAASAPPAVAASRIDAGGCVLTRETLTDLSTLDCWALRPQGSPPVLLLGRSDRPPPTRLTERFTASGSEVEAHQPPGFKEMMVYPEASIPAVEGFQRIEEWAIAHSSQVDASRPPGVPNLSTTFDLDRVRRTTVSFGPGQRLFGVISEPAMGGERHAPPVLFLTGGVVPRTSVNRMYVTLADELARRGHRTLRFDVSGIGESEPTPGHGGHDPHPPSLLDDVRCALGLLREKQPERPVWLVGLCSGAYAAFRSALEDPHVGGIVLLNPLHYTPADEHGRPDTEPPISVEEYRRAAFDLQRWKRFISDPRRIRRTLGAFARQARRSALGSATVDRRGSLVRTVADDLIALRERETEVHIIFAEGDPGQTALERLLGKSITRLGPAGVHVREVEGADHTFNSSALRDDLIQSILETISPPRAEASA